MVVPNLRQVNPRYAILAGVFIVVGGFYLVTSIRFDSLVTPAIPAASKPSSSLNYALKPIDQNSLRGALQRSHIRYEKMLKLRVGYMKEYGDQLKAQPFPFYRTFNVWDLTPPVFQCPHEIERLGAMGDGGKWTCGVSSRLSQKKDCVIYSFGVNQDSSFEEDVLETTKHCEIWGYDYSVDGWGKQILANHASRVHFNKVGLSGTDKKDDKAQYHTLETIMKQNGHTHIDLLKIDVEGSEFEALEAFIAPYLKTGKPLPFGQMQIELHLWGKTFDFFMGWWESLEQAGLRPFFAEPNLPYLRNYIGNPPDVSEFSFINVKGDHILIKDI